MLANDRNLSDIRIQSWNVCAGFSRRKVIMLSVVSVKCLESRLHDDGSCAQALSLPGLFGLTAYTGVQPVRRFLSQVYLSGGNSALLSLLCFSPRRAEPPLLLPNPPSSSRTGKNSCHIDESQCFVELCRSCSCKSYAICLL